MTPDEAILKLEVAAERADIEAAHYDADQILCELLRSLGHGNVVDAWEKITPKWYA